MSADVKLPEEWRSRAIEAVNRSTSINNPDTVDVVLTALAPRIKELVEATTRGDPESSLLWTARSLRNLAQALTHRGHVVKKNTVARLLKQLGYSLQGNKKCLEGAQHPDRNAQFEHINERVRAQLAATNPAISVDTKKKELGVTLKLTHLGASGLGME